MLDDKTVESMLKEVAHFESLFNSLGDSIERDLCCHIKALAAERDAWKARVLEECQRVEALNQLQARQKATMDEMLFLLDVAVACSGIRGGVMQPMKLLMNREWMERVDAVRYQKRETDND